MIDLASDNVLLNVQCIYYATYAIEDHVYTFYRRCPEKDVMGLMTCKGHWMKYRVASKLS